MVIVARYRLVVSDLDGTLLDPQGALSPRTLAVVRALRLAGVTLALATSRRWTGAAPIAEALGFSGSLILYDGALTRSFPDGGVQAEERLTVETAQRAAEEFVAHGVQAVVQYSDAAGEYLRVSAEVPHPEWAADYFTRYATQFESAPIDELCRGFPDPLRVVGFGPVAVLRRVAPRLSALGSGRQLMLLGSYGTGELTVFSGRASKGNALVALATRLGIPLAETLAIGDGLNDNSMLRVAGLGIAMGQALRRTRAAADVLTLSNRDDGAARAFARYVLGEGTGDLDEMGAR